MPGYFDHLKQATSNTPLAASDPASGAVSRLASSNGRLHPYAAAIRTAWLDRLDRLPRPWIKGASWDTNSFVVARKLIELANSGWTGYTLTAAHTDYTHHAPTDHAWDKREKCWDQALKHSGTQQLPEPPPGTPLPSVTVLDLDAQVRDAVSPPVNPIIDWHELFAADDDGEEWIIEPILPARRMVALYSAPKAGKSLLMLEIAVAIARGTEAIGTIPERPRKVLYVDFENDPRGDIRSRLEAMELAPDQLGNLCYLTFPSLAKFDTAQGAADLMRHVEHYDCEVVIIDTVSRAILGEENENDTWLAFYRHTGLALKRAEVACIRLDHSGKDRERGMRGGSAKSGDVDAVWRLTALGEDTIRLECTDNRMPVPTKSMILTRQDYPLAHTLEGAGWQAAADARTREVDELLDRIGVSTQLGERPAGRALREAGHKVNNRALREAVRLRRMRLDTQVNQQGSRTDLLAPGASAAQVRRTGGLAPGAPPP